MFQSTAARYVNGAYVSTENKPLSPGLKLYSKDGNTGYYRMTNDGTFVIENDDNVFLSIDQTGNATINGSATINGEMFANGDVHISGDTNQKGNLNISGDTNQKGNLNISGDTKQNGNFKITGTSETYGDTLSNGIYELSDSNLETNVSELNIDLDTLSGMSKTTYTFDGISSLGISGQELKQYYPELVITRSDGNYAVDYGKLSVVALTAIDKLYGTINSLNDTIEEMKNDINDLKDEVEKLKK